MVESEWSIIIFSKYFKIQFAWSTFQKRSWTVMSIMSTNPVIRIYCPLTFNGYSNSIKAVKRQRNLGLIHSVHKHRGNTFQRQNYKMRLKQRSLYITMIKGEEVVWIQTFTSLILKVFSCFSIKFHCTKSNFWIYFYIV
jgi:hypothetical protein